MVICTMTAHWKVKDEISFNIHYLKIFCQQILIILRNLSQIICEYIKKKCVVFLFLLKEKKSLDESKYDSK